MIKAIVANFKKFRDSLYNIFPKRADAVMELIDANSSNQSARSVVELSQEPLFRRKYSSITDAISNVSDDLGPIQNNIEKLLIEQCGNTSSDPFNLFVLDATPQQRKFSRTVEDKGYIHYPNAVAGNAPVSIGHQYSLFAYLPVKNEKDPPWLLPLSVKRVPTDTNATAVGIKQFKKTLSDNKFKDQLNVTAMDSAYGTPEFIQAIYDTDNAVNIARLRNNRTVYGPQPTRTKGYGQNIRYGKEMKLNDHETYIASDLTSNTNMVTSKGKTYNVCIEAWYDFRFRQKNGIPLHEYPFTMIKITVTEPATNKLIFKRPLWLMGLGNRRGELTLLQIYESYRRRYDIEHFFRFGKQKLLMDKYQTPATKYEESWWQLVMLAYTQLFIARYVSKKHVKPWEKYLPQKNNNDRICSPSEVQKDFRNLIHEFGTPAKPPKRRGSSPGRIKGEKQTKRIRYAVIKKAVDPPKIATIIE